MSKLKAFWASLPHLVQAAIVAFAAGSGAYLGEALSDPSALVVSLGEPKKFAAGAILAGIASLRAFYMTPNQAEKTP